MANNQYELVQHCLDTGEFITIKTSQRYLLLHRNLIKYSDNDELNLELPATIIQKLSGLNSISIQDAKIISHVDPSNYDIIIFPDKSIVYTRKRTLSGEDINVKKMKILPYYVYEDLELLKNFGMSQDDINLFVEKLNVHDKTDVFNSNDFDKIIQRIIYFTDIPTRLKCRQVSHKWKDLVDSSNSWNHVKLSKLHQHFDRALNYFQNIDIRELDLSESVFDLSTFKLQNEFYVYSLRSLCISTDHPLELFTLLFKLAPFLQHIKLIQTYNSSLILKNNNQLYEHINFVICQCQERLKCLRRLHIQLRSVSDQIFLESSSVTSIPVSYEVINFLSLYLLFLSIFGIFGVLKHHQVFLFFYIILLSILFLFQFILACTYLTIRGEKNYNLLKSNYQKSTDNIQLKYNCCGFDNATKFDRKETCKKLPCCQSSDQCCETLTMCYPLLSHELDKNLKIIGSIMLIFTLTQIIAIYMTLKYRNIRNPSLFVEM
ncbi:unnamed protein product [Adineta steineri]|uniref:F-box domain-containing protein n=1 Tax=Adineta steineri TaxID=433720 RepID=A0A813ZLJ0_9BILA|nr:unnamed protein product [Adineta steineri]CAF1000579.1 unnamed protein product [Adineta steineri]CAF1001002.1 unnamed protein product [Adineta steineri]